MKQLTREDGVFLGIIAALILVCLGVTAWLFLVKKDYHFIVEDQCDPATQVCYERDCSEADVCPPNGLSTYRIFTVRAADFPTCFHNSCSIRCAEGSIECQEVTCGESEEDVCAESQPAPSE